MKTMSSQTVHVIGGGLAGSEAAWQLARAGVPVLLHEMRPVRGTAAHVTDSIAELVCSNSFRSDDVENNAVGLLHEEMRRCGSLIMRAADAHRVPAGGALAVDRHGFSAAVQQALLAEPRELRIAQSGNRTEDARLFGVFQLGLESHHVPERAERIVLAQLDDGEGAPPGARVGEADRLHRPPAQRVGAARSRSAARLSLFRLTLM